MPVSQIENTRARQRYGTNVHKQLYFYGRLDLSPTELTAGYGFAWSVSGFLMDQPLTRVGPKRVAELKRKVADEITTTFASHYTAEVSLAGALSAEAINQYNTRTTGSKYLIKPWL